MRKNKPLIFAIRAWKAICKKKMPIGVSIALSFLLITYQNCGTKVIEQSSKSISLAKDMRLSDGNYINTIQGEVALHLNISKGGLAYTLSLKQESQNNFAQEEGYLVYTEGKVMFVPERYSPQKCANEEEMLNDVSTFEFTETSSLLALQDTELDSGVPFGLLFSKKDIPYYEFFGHAQLSCNIFEDIDEGKVQLGGAIPDITFEAPYVSDFEPRPPQNTDPSNPSIENPTVSFEFPLVNSSKLSEVIQEVNTKANSVSPCLQGERLSVVHFEAKIYNSTTLVAQQSFAISEPSTEPSAYFIGMSSFGDTLVVSKHQNRYVLSFSFCPYGTSLTPDRRIKAINTPYGIGLVDNGDDKFSTILSAKGIGALISSIGYYQESWFGPTTFFPVSFKSEKSADSSVVLDVDINQDGEAIN